MDRMSDRRPVIGICTVLARARWGVWERDAALLAVSYIDAIQRAGGLALMLPPDEHFEQDPDEVLDLLDGLILAGGDDIDPACYGAQAHPETTHFVPERDAAELALARRAIARDLPVLGICRGMQLINVAFGGTLSQHLPDELGHEDHRRTPGSFDDADHDVRLTPGSLAARAAGEELHPYQVPPPPGCRRDRRRLRGHRVLSARRAARGDRGARPPLRARRPVASRGRRATAASCPRWSRPQPSTGCCPQRPSEAAQARSSRPLAPRRLSGARAPGLASRAPAGRRSRARAGRAPRGCARRRAGSREARPRASAAAPASRGGRAVEASSTSRRLDWLSWRRATSPSRPGVDVAARQHDHRRAVLSR